MNIPGLSDEEISSVIYAAARKAAIKYRFGYHAVEDMQQHAAMDCIEKLNKGKFRPRADKPVKQQLNNFLTIVCRNSLYNLRRNKSFRYESGETPANRSKYNIMHPIKIHSQGLTDSNMFAFDVNTHSLIDKKHIVELIRKNLSVNETKVFLKYLNGVKLTIAAQADLFARIKEIINEETEDSLSS